jgi:GT2 family glycosyltransferase
VASDTLDQVFINHADYVSDKWEHYLSIYEAALSKIVACGRPVRLLEIGVQNGGSLQVWSKYLPQDSRIVGIDINPDCLRLPMDSNISIRIGDASDPIALDHILRDAEFDLIIDDGSHRPQDVIASFCASFKRLSPGGIYIVEDLHCSYYSTYDGGLRRPGTAIEWFKGLVDALNADHFEADAAVAVGGLDLSRLQELGGWIAQISFFDSMLIIEKLTSKKHQPYRRVVTGQKATVADLTNSITLMSATQLRKLVLPASAAAGFAPALLNALASAKEEVGNLRNAVAQAEVKREAEMRTVLERTDQQLREAQNRLSEESRLRGEAERRAEGVETQLVDEARRRIETLERAAAQRAVLASLRSQVAQVKAERDSLRTHTAQLEAERESLRENATQLAAERDGLQMYAARVAAEQDTLRRELDAVLNSTFWRMTGPARRLGAAMPPGFRRRARHSGRLLYWLATPYRTRKRLAYLQSQRAMPEAAPVLAIEPGAEAQGEPVAAPSAAVTAHPAIVPVSTRQPGEATIRAAALLDELHWHRRPEQAKTVIDQAKATHVAKKLAAIRSSGGELLTELQAAVSAWVASGSGAADLDGMVRAAGIMPIHASPAALPDLLPARVLDRYREAQIAIGERLRLDSAHAGTVQGTVRISILMPVYRVSLPYLERALLSVVCQTYANWELCIVDSGSKAAEITAALSYYEALDQRIRVIHLQENGGISAATNAALEMATGSYIGLLDHDDMLASNALEDVASHLAKDPAIDFVYTDECKIDENDVVQQLMPKPDWSPLLLTAFMYTGHFSIYRKSIVHRLGGFRGHYDYSQDYDLALRVAESHPKVVHIRSCHYGWRMTAGSASVGDKPHARASNIAALQDAINRRGWNRTAVALPSANRMVQRFDGEQPLVSIVIPTGGNIPMLKKCLVGILQDTDYRNLEVLVLDNTHPGVEVFPRLGGVANDPRVRLIEAKGPFNFSQTCNTGAATARGEIVVFLNDDVLVISPDWIECLLQCLTIPGVGLAGPKMLYENGSIQHAGMVTGTRRLIGTAFHTYPHDTSANMNLAQSLREVSLISAACLAIRKSLFQQVGGFDTVNVPREHSDVDFCLRVRELGYSCVYTPHAALTHVGHVSMGPAEAAGKVYGRHKHDVFIMKRFSQFLTDDPYFPQPLRDILYTDSPEDFRYFPRRERVPTVGRSGNSSAYGHVTALDILIISHDLSESGAPRAVFDMAGTLHEGGHFVVVASPEDGPYRERLRDIGIDVIIDELLLDQDRSVFDFARNFDKVVCNTIVCWPAVAQLRDVVEVYWYVHESNLIRDFVEKIPEFAPLLKSEVAVWADSRLAARSLLGYGVEARVIEYGIADQSACGSVSRDNAGNFVAGVFGSYEPRKGQDLAVEGVLSLPQKLRDRVELRLFGRTLFEWFRDDLDQIAGSDRSIMFCGEVDHNECLKQMAECDIILVPSRDDALSFVALDALSLGKPLICSESVGASEYLQDGRSALILHENTPEEIGRVLARAIADRDLRTTIGRGGRQVWEKTFSMRAFTGKLQTALGIDLAPSDGRQVQVTADHSTPG